MSDLTALLEHEASAEIEAILSEARQRASDMVASARGEAEAAAVTLERAAAMQREALTVRAQSAAQLEASALKLRAQHEAVESVFALVQERIEALQQDPKAYEGVLGGLLTEALGALRSETPSEIVVAERDLKLAKTVAAAQGVTAPVVAGDVAGGVRVRTGRGSSIENTLHGRLAMLRGELASQVADVLFAEAATA